MKTEDLAELGRFMGEVFDIATDYELEEAKKEWEKNHFEVVLSKRAVQELIVALKYYLHLKKDRSLAEHLKCFFEQQLAIREEELEQSI